MPTPAGGQRRFRRRGTRGADRRSGRDGGERAQAMLGWRPRSKPRRGEPIDWGSRPIGSEKVAQAAGSARPRHRHARGALQALRQVATAAQEIGQVALQTRLVAASASVEASGGFRGSRPRAGRRDRERSRGKGRAIGIVAIARTVNRLDEKVGELAAECSGDGGRGAPGGIGRALAQAEADIAGIATGRASATCAPARRPPIGCARSHRARPARRTRWPARTKRTAPARASESVYELIAHRRIRDTDTPYIWRR